MYLMYIDESGDTSSLSQGGSKYLVLSGSIIHEDDILAIEESFRRIKIKYYQDPDVEIKSNFLRYANPDLAESSPIKIKDREKYNELESDMTKYLREIPTTLCSIVIDKGAYWRKYPAQNPYDVAYIFLLERFQKYLDSKKALGISIIDPREGQVEKHFIGNELMKIHNKMRWEDSELWKKCTRIIEKLLFSQSDKTIGIQITDLYCYPIFHMFEYDKKPGSYWRFDELSFPKLQRSPSGQLQGWGLKIFPDNTKIGLRFS